MTTQQPRSEGSRPGHKRLRRSRGRVHVNGAWLAYERVGSGLPVVFVPKLGTDRRVWEKQVRSFAARYEVIRYDPRGCGKSSLGPYPVRHAEDLAGLLDALGIQQTALVSVDTSAEIALELAVDQPQRVGTLVLAIPWVRELARRLRLSGRQPIVEPRQVVRTRAERRTTRAASWRLLVIVLDILLRDLRYSWSRNPRPGYAPPWWGEVPVLDRLAEVASPTVVVLGEWTSPFAYARAELLQAAIPTDLDTVP
jgi:pimeloyl-ACP methyl ester carboxylesterase